MYPILPHVASLVLIAVLTLPATGNASTNAEPTTTPAKRLPVPSAAEQARVRSRVREIFAEQYKSYHQLTNGGLASTLIAHAKKSTDAAEKYVLLWEARDLATAQRLFPLAFHSIDAIALDFDADARHLKLEVLREGLTMRGAPSGDAYARNMANLILAFADEVIAADDYATALSAVGLAKWVCRQGGATSYTKLLADRTKDIEALQEQFKRAEIARQRLDQSPDDPGANLIVGRFLFFSKGDFDRGLPHLAKGSDAQLRSLAQSSNASPSTAADQHELGSRWWTYADQSTGTAKRHARRYAALWYRNAIPHLAGLEKTLAEKRVAEAGTP